MFVRWKRSASVQPSTEGATEWEWLMKKHWFAFDIFAVVVVVSVKKELVYLFVCVRAHRFFFQNWTTSYGVVVVDGNKREISRWRRNMYTYTLIHYTCHGTRPHRTKHTKRIAIAVSFASCVTLHILWKLHIASSSAYTQWNSSVNRC